MKSAQASCLAASLKGLGRPKQPLRTCMQAAACSGTPHARASVLAHEIFDLRGPDCCRSNLVSSCRRTDCGIARCRSKRPNV
eukprot:1158998-Pelagomonas_calceolata.AAC.4